MAVVSNVTNIYRLDISVLALQAGGILNVNVLNFGSGPIPGQFVDNNGQLSQADDGVTTLSLNGGPAQPIDYLGSGTATTLLGLFPRSIAVFAVGSDVYIYAPDGLPPLSGLAITLNVNPNGTFNLPAAADGSVDGLDVGEAMGVGYTDLQGDQITAGPDRIFGFGGNDTISAGGGNDTVFGGAGNDQIAGQDGNDELHGDAGNDSLDGGTGNDLLFGGAGQNLLLGGDGNDTLTAGTGPDTLTGGAGADRFVVNGGAHLITDLDAATGIGDGDGSNNDFVDLSAFYNETTLAAWNAANPGQRYASPLAWLRTDQADDGILQQAGGLRLQAGGVPVAGTDLSAENTGVLCFASGTRILTRSGAALVEDLNVGDEVLLFDGGYATIRWIGSRRYSSFELRKDDRLLPVRIKAGALGHGLPERDLLVTRQHRCLLRSPIAKRMFGMAEVLVPAKDLRDLDGVATDTRGGAVEYWHLLLDDHVVLFSECAPTESLLVGEQAVNMLLPEAVEEIALIFPGLKAVGQQLARPEARGQRARSFVRRMVANEKLPISWIDDFVRLFDSRPTEATNRGHILQGG